MYYSNNKYNVYLYITQMKYKTSCFYISRARP